MQKVKTIDYPAGHSADTDWFCVDKDGNIAIFDTDQSGCMPVNENGEAISAWYDYLNNVLREIEPHVYDFTLGEETITDLLKLCKKEDLQKEYFGGIIILKKGTTIGELNLKLRDYEFLLRLSEEQNMYFLHDSYNEKLFKKVVKNGLVLSGYYFDIKELWKVLNLFYYHSDHSNLPYKREFAPENPANINDMNFPKTNTVVAFKDVDFRDNEYVQPMEFIECSEGYIDCDVFEDGSATIIASDNKTPLVYYLGKDEWLLEFESRRSFRFYKPNSNGDVKPFLNSANPEILILNSMTSNGLGVYGLPAMCLNDIESSNYKYLQENVFEPLNLEFKNIAAFDVIKSFERYVRKNKLKVFCASDFPDSFGLIDSEIKIVDPRIIIGVGNYVHGFINCKYGLVPRNEIFTTGEYWFNFHGKEIMYIAIEEFEKRKDYSGQYEILKGIAAKAKEIISKPSDNKLRPYFIKLEKDNKNYDIYMKWINEWKVYEAREE